MTTKVEHTLDTELATEHYTHLQDEGFTPDEIWEIEQDGAQSLTQGQSLRLGFKVWSEDENKWVSSPGLKFPFTKTFAQVRCDNPLPRKKGKPAKYLTPYEAKSEAMLPLDCIVITEGAKDAWAGRLKGKVSTGCVAGVSHIKKALPEDCRLITLFDSDGWKNPSVAGALITAADHCNGKIQLVPHMDKYPKGGLCEYFKVGHTPEQYAELLDGAMWPDEFLWQWANRFKDYEPKLKAECIRVASNFAHLMGRIAA